MKEVRFFYVPDAAHQEELPPDEAMHAMRVLRLKGGDEMMLMDGVGNYYRAEVTIAATHHCYYKIKECLPQQPQWKGHLHLGIAPTKTMDRIEWMTEKATELGVDEISYLCCQFSERRLLKTTAFLRNRMKVGNTLPIATMRSPAPICLTSYANRQTQRMSWCSSVLKATSLLTKWNWP